ncbi:MAG: AraC family transcriptional regulator [Propionibacterium sp.]|nr:AraC family transcriptional regulator [Propionibacterium sp.]
MAQPDDPRGILYPSRLPSFHREPPPDELVGLVRWFWVPRWNLRDGEVSRQEILPFPASILVVEPDGVTLHGPTTGASHRELRGRGWAVGASLRPAAIASVHPQIQAIRDDEVPFDAPDLRRHVADAMADDAPPARAVARFAAWAIARLTPPDEAGRLANAMEDLISTDRGIVRVEHVAERLGVTVRTVQRLARSHVGVPPLAMIRRYRLQEAAQRLREDPTLTIAAIAAGLGYADQAHLATDFRTVLGLSPSSYRGRHSR